MQPFNSHIAEYASTSLSGQHRTYKRILVRWLGWVGLVSLILAATLTQTHARQSSANLAGLVVRFADDRVETACIDLGVDGTATGLEVLQASGLDVQVADSQEDRTAVCKIADDGCNRPGNTCFCECRQSEGSCTYWAYFHLEDGSWQYGGLNPKAYTVEPGDVEGWSWGEGALGRSGTEPPLRTFEEICQDGPGSQDTQPQTGPLVCPVGQSVMIEGTGPGNTELLLFFSHQPVGGGISNAEGYYRIPLVVGDERPGNYLVEVKTRLRRNIVSQMLCEVPEPSEP